VFPGLFLFLVVTKTKAMKKMTLLILLLVLSVLNMSAPPNKCLYIKQASPIKPYQSMIYAIGKVECNFDTLAYNPKEQACGYFQIRPIRVKDYNERTGSNYTLEDMFDYYKAEKVFLYFAMLLQDPDLIIRKWNGSGPMTYEYLKNVKKYML